MSRLSHNLQMYWSHEADVLFSLPAKLGRPIDKLPAGRYRRLMKVRFDRRAYQRRSQVETVILMIKRRQGAHVRGRTYHSRCRDLRLLVLTHEVMILLRIEVFSRARMSLFRHNRWHMKWER